MIKETTTTYAYKLQYIENLTFDKIRGFSKRFIDDLPKPLVDDLYSQLERGVVQIDSEPQMLVYLYAFGNMHQAKLNKAFENVPEVFFEQPEINIVDYGCGQAIGTMCYIDFLKNNNHTQKIKKVTLVEPSEICLKRAALHVSQICSDSEIVTINKPFDNMSDEDIVCEEDTPTLHILSNVLDLQFDVRNFAQLIRDNMQGYNQFVCVGPYFGFSEKDERFEEFCSLLDGTVNFYKVFDKYQLNPEKAWTAQIRCFSVGELEEDLSTEVTDMDIENGVEDEFGAVYSRDGKKLLRGWYEDSKNHKIKDGTKVICDFAFNFHTLQQITIPDSVTSIGDFAFNCESLQKIILPESITSIGRNPFSECKRIEILSKSPRFIVNSDCLIDNVQHILISYFGHSSSVDVPNSVTSIGDSAFSGCESLEQISIPNSVTSIGNYAFDFCESLQQITIPNSVTSIGVFLFGFESLQQIIIPENSIEKFKKMLPKYLWDKLYYLVKAVNDDEQDVLSTKVTEEDITNGLEDDDGVVYSKDGKRLLKETCYIYNEVSEMLRDEPYDIQLTDFLNINYSIKEGTKVICDRAFYHGWDYYNGEYISNLEEIHIPPTIKFIGEEAFLGCKLKTVIIPNSVTSIGQGAFMGCSLLQEITIPNSVINIGNDAFYGCNSLQQIIISINSVEKFKKLLPKYLWDKFMINPDFPPPLPF